MRAVAGHSCADFVRAYCDIDVMDSAIEPEEPIISPPWGEFGRVATLGLVSLVSKFVFNVWNTTKISNQAELLRHVQHRSGGQGLITVSNHTRQVESLVTTHFAQHIVQGYV